MLGLEIVNPAARADRATLRDVAIDEDTDVSMLGKRREQRFPLIGDRLRARRQGAEERDLQASSLSMTASQDTPLAR